MKRLQTVLAHLCLIFSLLFLTLLAIHLFNPRMQMLSGSVMQIYLFLFCLAAMGLSLLLLMEKTYRLRKRANRLTESKRGKNPVPKHRSSFT